MYDDTAIAGELAEAEDERRQQSSSTEFVIPPDDSYDEDEDVDNRPVLVSDQKVRGLHRLWQAAEMLTRDPTHRQS